MHTYSKKKKSVDYFNRKLGRKRLSMVVGVCVGAAGAGGR